MTLRVQATSVYALNVHATMGSDDRHNKVFQAGCKDRLMRPTKTDDTRLAKSDRDGEIHINQRRIYSEDIRR